MLEGCSKWCLRVFKGLFLACVPVGGVYGKKWVWGDTWGDIWGDSAKRNVPIGVTFGVTRLTLFFDDF